MYLCSKWITYIQVEMNIKWPTDHNSPAYEGTGAIHEHIGRGKQE